MIIIFVAIIEELRQGFPENRTVYGSIIIIITFILLGSELFTMAISDAYAYRNFYKTGKHYYWDRKQFPDQVISNQIEELSNKRIIFVYGNRAWLYVFSNMISSNKYFYANSMFRKGYLSQEVFEEEISNMIEKPPELIVVWPNHPSMKDDFYDINYVMIFEEFLYRNYKLVRKYNFEYS